MLWGASQNSIMVGNILNVLILEKGLLWVPLKDFHQQWKVISFPRNYYPLSLSYFLCNFHFNFKVNMIGTRAFIKSGTLPESVSLAIQSSFHAWLTIPYTRMLLYHLLLWTLLIVLLFSQNCRLKALTWYDMTYNSAQHRSYSRDTLCHCKLPNFPFPTWEINSLKIDINDMCAYGFYSCLRVFGIAQNGVLKCVQCAEERGCWPIPLGAQSSFGEGQCIFQTPSLPPFSIFIHVHQHLLSKREERVELYLFHYVYNSCSRSLI